MCQFPKRREVFCFHCGFYVDNKMRLHYVVREILREQLKGDPYEKGSGIHHILDLSSCFFADANPEYS
jgi:hypothetical protein